MIYYVEDDKNIRDLAIYALNQAGFEVAGFPCAKDFENACSLQMPDLVLLDIMLPGKDGMEILESMRLNPSTRHIPVMMLTAKGSEIDKVQGLDLGADDYLAKPFGMMELVSRANALLRRARRAEVPSQDGRIVCGSLMLDPAAHRVEAAGTVVDLTLKEFELLQVLMENPGHALSRAQLFEAVWGSAFYGGTRTVDVHMQTLRQKLDRTEEGLSAMLETVRGVGYRLRSAE